MVRAYTHGKISWTDLENPTDEEVDSIADSHRLHRLVRHELRSPSKSSKAVLYDDYLYLVLQFPIRVKTDDHHVVVDHEIDFVIGRDFIATIHYKPIEPLYNFGKAVETNSILEKDKNSEDEAGHLFYYVVRRMYDHMRGDIEAVNAELSTAEDKIFSGKEKSMVEVISGLSRELLDFRQTCRAHYETLESLEAQSGRFFDKTFGPYVSDIKEGFTTVRDAVVNGHELAKELRETNDSLLSTKQNETIRTLTVIAFIFYPATFIAALFTIPAAYVPLIGTHNGWMEIFDFMIIMTIVIWIIIKKKRWI